MIKLVQSLSELDKYCQKTSKPHSIIIGVSEEYFSYLLILLENIRQISDQNAYDILLVFDHLPKTSEINILNSIQYNCICFNINIFNNCYSLNLLSKLSFTERYSYGMFYRYLPYYFSKFYRTVTNLDVDTYIHQDILPQLDKFADNANHLYKIRTFYDKQIMQEVGQNSLYPDLMKTSLSLDFIHAGVSTVTHNFNSICDSHKYLDELAKAATKWISYTESKIVYEEALIPLVAMNTGIKITPYPDFFNITFDDLSPYANNTNLDFSNLYILHHSNIKLWDSPDFNSLFPNYIKYKNIVLDLLFKHGITDNTLYNQINAQEFRIQSLYNQSNLISTYYIYRYSLPILIKHVSHSKFFEIKTTQSYDRIILWSKHLPEYFRVEIITLRPHYDPNLHLVAIVLRYNRSFFMNASLITYPYCEQLEFFKKIADYFSKSRIYVENNRIYLSIPFKLQQLAPMLDKLELYLLTNIESYLKL